MRLVKELASGATVIELDNGRRILKGNGGPGSGNFGHSGGSGDGPGGSSGGGGSEGGGEGRTLYPKPPKLTAGSIVKPPQGIFAVKNVVGKVYEAGDVTVEVDFYTTNRKGETTGAPFNRRVMKISDLEVVEKAPAPQHEIYKDSNGEVIDIGDKLEPPAGMFKVKGITGEIYKDHGGGMLDVRFKSKSGHDVWGGMVEASSLTKK